MAEPLEPWLQYVPHEDDVIRLRGRVTRSHAEVAVVVASARLSLAPEDIVRISPGRHAAECVVFARRGAMLLSVDPVNVAPGQARRPFALRVRREVTRTPPAPRFRALEREFLEAHDVVAR